MTVCSPVQWCTNLFDKEEVSFVKRVTTSTLQSFSNAVLERIKKSVDKKTGCIAYWTFCKSLWHPEIKKQTTPAYLTEAEIFACQIIHVPGKFPLCGTDWNSGILYPRIPHSKTSLEKKSNKMFVSTTEPSYQNESSDSVSCKPLDGFKNAFNTK